MLSGSPQQDWLDYYLPAAARDYALVLSKPIYLTGLPGLRCRIFTMAPLLVPSRKVAAVDFADRYVERGVTFVGGELEFP